MSWNIIELDVIRWSEDKGIIPNSTPLAQLQKAKEELQELEDAINDSDRDGAIDGLGDTLVCLINVAALMDLDLTQCLKAAYNEIKGRTGHMGPDGIFVKDAA